MRSLSILAVGLAFAPETIALVANNALPKPHIGNAKQVPRQDVMICVEDQYYQFLFNSTFGEQFCQDLLDYPNVTVTVDYTPISTTTDLFTTKIITETSAVQFTPLTTVTVTATNQFDVAQAAAITLAPRYRAPLRIEEVFQMYRRQHAAAFSSASSSLDGYAALSASFSSACACQTYDGPTVTITQTESLSIFTRSAFEISPTTRVITRTAGTVTIYTTVVAGGESGSPSLRSPSITPSTSLTESTTCSDSSILTPRPPPPSLTLSTRPPYLPSNSSSLLATGTGSGKVSSGFPRPTTSSSNVPLSSSVPFSTGSFNSSSTSPPIPPPFPTSTTNKTTIGPTDPVTSSASFSVTLPIQPANNTSVFVGPTSTSQPASTTLTITVSPVIPSSGFSLSYSSQPKYPTNSTGNPINPTSILPITSLPSGFPFPSGSGSLPVGPWNSTTPIIRPTGTGFPSISLPSRYPGTGSILTTAGPSFTGTVSRVSRFNSSSFLPTAPLSCPPIERATTTIYETLTSFATITSYGCFSDCASPTPLPYDGADVRAG